MSTASFLALAAIIACIVLHGGPGVWAKVPASLPPASAPLTPAPESLPPAPSSSSGPGFDCTTALFNLTTCLTYVEAGSTVPTPDKECCPALAGLMESQPICLCELLAGGAENFGIKIDDSKALKLPSICKVETPPPSTCAELGYNIPKVEGMAPAPASTNGGPFDSTMASPPMTAGTSSEFQSAGLFSLVTLSFFAAVMSQVLI